MVDGWVPLQEDFLKLAKDLEGGGVCGGEDVRRVMRNPLTDYSTARPVLWFPALGCKICEFSYVTFLFIVAIVNLCPNTFVGCIMNSSTVALEGKQSSYRNFHPYSNTANLWVTHCRCQVLLWHGMFSLDTTPHVYPQSFQDLDFIGIFSADQAGAW